MAKSPTIFECQHCGYSSAKWLGRCPDCGGWNSFVEEKRPRAREASAHHRGKTKATPLTEVVIEETPRIETRNPEFDRVLGGGLVPGSLVLLGGEPGAGKSTLLLQIAHSLQRGGRRVLYASGEESMQQIRLRAERLDVLKDPESRQRQRRSTSWRNPISKTFSRRWRKCTLRPSWWTPYRRPIPRRSTRRREA